MEINPDRIKRAYADIRTQLSKRIVGQERVVEELVTAFFAGGHCLLMGVPGLAKTLLIRTFAESLSLKFNRIQFTPDLMPSDITGTDVLASESGGTRKFSFLWGPIYANVVLADEINRTPPKTQSALLEAMEEAQVTVAGQRYHLPKPFFVMATQNPIEQEGTYPLPLAALDRFLFKVQVDYPAYNEELEMLFATTSGGESKVEQIVAKDDIIEMLDAVRNIAISDEVLTYATRIVRETRPAQTTFPYIKEMVEVGGSPRAVQALILGGKAHAAIDGRGEVRASDVRAIAHPALRHRVIPSFHATADNIRADDLIDYVLEKVPRPADDVTQASPKRQSFSLARWLLGSPKPRKKKHTPLKK